MKHPARESALHLSTWTSQFSAPNSCPLCVKLAFCSGQCTHFHWNWFHLAIPYCPQWNLRIWKLKTIFLEEHGKTNLEKQITLFTNKFCFPFTIGIHPSERCHINAKTIPRFTGASLSPLNKRMDSTTSRCPYPFSICGQIIPANPNHVKTICWKKWRQSLYKFFLLMTSLH